MQQLCFTIEANGLPAQLTLSLLDCSAEVNPKRRRPIVVICPGGSYEMTSDREAEPIALRFHAMGYHTCVLRYSCRPAVFPTALEQLAKTVAFLRAHAKVWHIDPDRIAVMGFSAGGHLAASLGVFWNRPFLYEALHVTPRQICPNALILCYPVITCAAPFCHKGSLRALLGNSNKEDARAFQSLETQVTADMPQTFLWHTGEDTAVPMENSLLLAQAMRKNNVPFALHIFAQGGHGLSLGTTETAARPSMQIKEVQCWPALVQQWLTQGAFRDKKA